MSILGGSFHLKGNKGFTLLELMLVVAVIAILSAMAVPALLNARKAANEAAAISMLRTLTSVNEQYQTRFEAYAGTLGNLSVVNYIDNSFGSGQKQGFTFTYAGGTDSWTCAADPTSPGESGDRHFYIDATGVIRMSSSGPASTTDPPID